MFEKLIDRIWEGLTSSPLQAVSALIIFLIALPLIRSSYKAPPAPAPPVAPPQPAPIEIESPWFVQNFLQMQSDVEKLRDQVALLSSQVAGIAQLLRRRSGRKPAAKSKKKGDAE